MNEYKVRIVNDFCRMGIKIYLFIPRGNNEAIFVHPGAIDEKGHISYAQTILKIDGGAAEVSPPPFMEFPMSLSMEFPEFFGKLMTELNEFGIKSPDKSFVEGELQATKEHLKDMRRLVFEPNIDIPNDLDKDAGKKC
jgi:hypothetical protein